MKVIVFDLGGTLMEYRGMPDSWVDYYEQGFKEINKKHDCKATKSDIEKSVELLKSYNPRVNYREEELSPEYIFSKVLEHWKTNTPVNHCVDAFFEGLKLEAALYSDTMPALESLRNKGYKIAALTDLPSAMPDKLFKRHISGLLNYLDLYVSSQSCGYRKPNCKGLKLISDHYNVPVTELIFVGDEEKDRKTAFNANCRFIMLNRKEKTPESIHNLYELLEMLN